MTKVFIVIPWFSPAFRAGGPIRSIENLIVNYNEDIQYRIFCSNRDVDGTLLANVQCDSWTDMNNYTKIWYHSKGIPYNNINKCIQEEQPDKLFIVGCFSFQYNIMPLLFCKGVSKILSTRGMLHPGALSQKKIKKNLLLFIYKCIGIKNKIVFHATDAKEKEYIHRVFGSRILVKVAENFPAEIRRQTNHCKQKNHLRLLSVGLITPMKNNLLVLQALKNVKGKVEYHIVGAVKDSAYWNQCLQEIKNTPENVNIIIHGELTHYQVSELLQQTQVLVLPSKSENYGHAIIENLSIGNPVITSNYTPWNELKESNAGVNVDLNIEAISEAINYFISLTHAEFEKYSEGARVYFEKMNQSNKVKRQYLQLFGGNTIKTS